MLPLTLLAKPHLVNRLSHISITLRYPEGSAACAPRMSAIARKLCARMLPLFLSTWGRSNWGLSGRADGAGSGPVSLAHNFESSSNPCHAQRTSRPSGQARRPAAARAGTPIATGLPARADRPAARASGLACAGRPAVRPLPARAGPVRPLLAQGPPLQLVCPRAFAQALSQQICLRGAQRPGLAQTCPDLPGFARICLDFGPKTAPQIALTCLGTPNNQLASVWIPSPCVYSLFSSGVA